LENLLKRLTAVDRSSIAEVALDIIDESGQQRRDEGSATLDPEQIWKLGAVLTVWKCWRQIALY